MTLFHVIADAGKKNRKLMQMIFFTDFLIVDGSEYSPFLTFLHNSLVRSNWTEEWAGTCGSKRKQTYPYC